MIEFLITLTLVIIAELFIYVKLQKAIIKRKVVRVAQQCALMDLNKQIQDTIVRDFGPLTPEQQNLPSVQKIIHEALEEIKKNSKAFEDLQKKIDKLDFIEKCTHIHWLDSLVYEDILDKGL